MLFSTVFLLHLAIPTSDIHDFAFFLSWTRVATRLWILEHRLPENILHYGACFTYTGIYYPRKLGTRAKN